MSPCAAGGPTAFDYECRQDVRQPRQVQPSGRKNVTSAFSRAGSLANPFVLHHQFVFARAPQEAII